MEKSNRILIILYFGGFTVLLIACAIYLGIKEFNRKPVSLTDKEIKEYRESTKKAIISPRNLNVTFYRDGTPIPKVTDPIAWSNLTTGAWCDYGNDIINGVSYGKLYNWYAMQGIHDSNPNTPNKIIAPEGWHIPTPNEVDDEILRIDNSYNPEGLMAGYRDHKGAFHSLKSIGYFWGYSNTAISYSEIESDGVIIFIDELVNKKNGISIRCFKNEK